MNSEKPLVSVFMITYNHEKYIAQAIEGVLMQKTSFPFELIIGEDCSTDQTREIVVDYANRYPAIIKPILHETNVGAKANSKSVREACRGKYVALCEGDDYWIDPLKLQKQVDFMESHPDFSMCFHRAKKVDVQGKELGTCWPKKSWSKPVTYTEDIVERNYISTQTVVYRRGLFDQQLFDILAKGLSFGDWVLHILNSLQGKIMFLDESMAAYRVTGTGASATTTSIKLQSDILKLYERMEFHLGNQVPKEKITQFRKRQFLILARLHAEKGENELAKNYLENSKENNDRFFANVKLKAAAHLSIYYPWIYSITKKTYRLARSFR